MSKTLKELAVPGRHVIVLHDTPRPRAHVPDCLAMNAEDPHACDIPAREPYAHDCRQAERDAAAGVGASVVDPFA